MAIILTTLRFGTYRSTDQILQDMRDNKTQLVNWGLHNFVASGGENPPSLGGDSNLRLFGNDATSPNSAPGSIFNPNMYVVLYDAQGRVLNPDSDWVAETISRRYALSHAFIDNIDSTQIQNEKGGATYNFRTVIFPSDIQLSDTGGQVTTRVRYIQVLISVDQVQDSLQETQNTIILVIVIFWLLSLLVAIYLSRWSLLPLQAALERQKAFVSNASHELRTPLAILQNRLQLLFQNPSATIIDESENISASLNEVRNMRLLTQNLLDVARQDRTALVTQEVRADFFDDIFKNYEMLAADAGKHFVGAVTTGKPMKIDPNLTKQLLTIFFDNAMKYTDDTGEISMSVRRVGQSLEYSIADNGPGIDDEAKSKIFDRFYRVDEARTRGKGGLGLGLSLAKMIVDKMKGKIVVSDNAPRGTVFVIRVRG